MLDMHFFQHFLLQCRPVYPLGNQQVWKHDVLCLSHHHNFLLYAILGFAAADLEANGGTNSTLSVPAMTYRFKAIQLFRKAITSFQEPEKSAKAAPPTETKNPRPRKSANIAGEAKPQTDSQHYGQSIMSLEQGSALVASCYLLMGQSQYLGDGIQDFMTLTRGSASLRAEMIRLGFPPLFQNLEPKDSVETMRQYLQGVPPLDKPWIDAGKTSLEMLKVVCADRLQLAYLANLENILLYSKTDTFKVYTSVMGHFLWWSSLPFDEFQRIIDMTDQVNVLLATHWVALMMTMAFLRKASSKINDDSKKQSDAPAPQGLRGAKAQAKDDGKCTEPWYYWLVCMNGWITGDYRKFNAWPHWVQDRLDEDATYFYS
ncbi:Gal4-like transcriptional regulator [Cordyceps javanica]|nr:Gal4-like transcriptional regulator [Cordyceps javanica]